MPDLSAIANFSQVNNSRLSRRNTVYLKKIKNKIEDFFQFLIFLTKI